LVPRLSARHRVITLDNRGVGRTGVAPAPFDVARMAADVVEVLDAAGVEQVHLLGLSMGGLIAQEVAVTRPERVHSLMLAASHVGIPRATRSNPLAAAALLASVQLPPDERARVLEPFIYWPGTPRNEIERDNEARSALPTTDAGFLSQLVASRDWTRADDLGELAVPTLVLHGRDDLLVPPSNAHQLAAAVPSSRLEILDECSHQVFTDQERLAAEVVLAFTDDVEHAALGAAS
jgi:3-oxoadipate enol-lactonase